MLLKSIIVEEATAIRNKAQQKHADINAFSKSHSQQQKPLQAGGNNTFDNQYSLKRLNIVYGIKSYPNITG